MQRFIIGKSELVEAEYSFRSDAPYTELEFWGDECVVASGHTSKAKALASGKAICKAGKEDENFGGLEYFF